MMKVAFLCFIFYYLKSEGSHISTHSYKNSDIYYRNSGYKGSRIDIIAKILISLFKERVVSPYIWLSVLYFSLSKKKNLISNP